MSKNISEAPAAMKLLPARRGRPRKFGRPARAVTVTLPEDVIDVLSAIDPDVSRAIVTLSARQRRKVPPRPPAELANYGDSAVILVKPLRALSRISGVTLVPLPDGRALISLPDSMTVFEFELKVRDTLEEHNDLEPWERTVMGSVSDILKAARRTKGVVVHERRIIVLQSPRHRRISGG